MAGAERLLPLYFRPLYTQGQVHERVGWSHRKDGDAEQEHTSFMAAVRAYDQAEDLLDKALHKGGVRAAQATRKGIAVRRRKCRLLSGDSAQSTLASQELQQWVEPAGATSLTLYNAACLMAVAIGVLDDEAEATSLLERRAWYLLGRSLLVGGADGPWQLVLTDIELQNLDAALRSRFCAELMAHNPDMAKLPDVEAGVLAGRIMKALDLVPPP